MDKATEIKQVCTELLLVPFEGYHTKLANGSCTAYPDPGPNGLPVTIGYGSTYNEDGSLIQLGDVWTHAHSVYMKSIELNKALGNLMIYSPKLFNEPASRIAAVLSWIYNCGIGNYRVSTFKKKIDACEWEDAAEQCKKWDKAKGKVLRGLTRRRAAEANLIINPI